GFHRRDFFRIENLHRQSELASHLRRRDLVLQTVLSVADHDDAIFLEDEVVAPFASELDETGTACEIELENERRRLQYVLDGRRSIKFPGPFDEPSIQARLHVERALGIPHPLQRQANRTRSSQRHEM